MPERTIICRCEDLTLADIREIIARGVTTLEEIKRLTRCGMGPCQGRTCRPLVADELSRMTGVPLSEIALPTFRPPTKPVKLGLFLDGDPAPGRGTAHTPGAPGATAGMAPAAPAPADPTRPPAAEDPRA